MFFLLSIVKKINNQKQGITIEIIIKYRNIINSTVIKI